MSFKKPCKPLIPTATYPQSNPSPLERLNVVTQTNPLPPLEVVSEVPQNASMRPPALERIPAFNPPPLEVLGGEIPPLEILEETLPEVIVPLERITAPQSSSNGEVVGWPYLGADRSVAVPQNQSEGDSTPPPLVTIRTGEVPSLAVSPRDEYSYVILGVDESDLEYDIRAIYTTEFLQRTPDIPFQEQLKMACVVLINKFPKRSYLAERVAGGHITNRVVLPQGANPFNVVLTLELLDDGYDDGEEREDEDPEDVELVHTFKVLKIKSNSSDLDIALHTLHMLQ